MGTAGRFNLKNSHFNSLIHAPNRFHICAISSTSAEIEFKLLRERLDVSDSVLSKHLNHLKRLVMLPPQKEGILDTDVHEFR